MGIGGWQTVTEPHCTGVGDCGHSSLVNEFTWIYGITILEEIMHMLIEGKETFWWADSALTCWQCCILPRFNLACISLHWTYCVVWIGSWQSLQLRMSDAINSLMLLDHYQKHWIVLQILLVSILVGWAMWARFDLPNDLHGAMSPVRSHLFGLLSKFWFKWHDLFGAD